MEENEDMQVKGEVKVKIRGKQYVLPREMLFHAINAEKENEFARIIAVSRFPSREDRVIVWRKQTYSDGSERTLGIEAALKDGRIVERTEGQFFVNLAARGISEKRKDELNVYDFKIREDLRRKGIGTAMREMFISKAKSEGFPRIVFPGGKYQDETFYKDRGMRTKSSHDGGIYAPYGNLADMDYGKRKDLVPWAPKMEKAGLEILWTAGKLQPKQKVAEKDRIFIEEHEGKLALKSSSGKAFPWPAEAAKRVSARQKR